MTRRLFQSSLFFAVSLLSVQGTGYILQILSAARLSPPEYSSIRIAESAAAIGALLVSFGVPSALLVKMADGTSGGSRPNVLRASTWLILSTGCPSLLLYFGVAHLFGFESSPVIATLTTLVSIRLLLTSVAQARGRYAFLAAASLAGSAASFAVFFGAVKFGAPGIWSWSVARCVVEGVVVASLIIDSRNLFKRPSISGTAAPTYFELATLAVPVGASLIIRALVEHGPVLWLAFCGAPALLIARVGLIVTLGTVALVPVSVVQAVLVPQIAATTASLSLSSAIRTLSAGAVTTALLMTSFILIADTKLQWSEIASAHIIASGVLMIVAKMIASMCGGLLLAYQKGSVILSLNAVTLAICLVVALLFGKYLGTGSIDVAGILWIIASIELIAASLYLLTAKRSCSFPSRS